MKLFQFIGMLCMFFLIMVIGVSCKEQLVPGQTFGKEDETTEEAGSESDSGGRKVTFACWNTQTFLMRNVMELSTLNFRDPKSGPRQCIQRGLIHFVK